MRKLAVSIEKGGTGKSTTAVSLAAGLAKAGKKTLIVDTDTQGQIVNMLGIRPKYGLAQAIYKEVPLAEAILPARENLWVLAGGRDLAAVKNYISRKEFGGEKTLIETLAPIEGQYDYVVIDCSPGWDTLTINVLFYAEELIVPVSLEIMTIQQFIEFSKNVSNVQKHNPNLHLKYILPTFLDGRVKKSFEIYDQLKNMFSEKLCPPIRYNVSLSEAPGHKQTIFEFAPSSRGAEDYQKLVERINEYVQA